MPLIPLRKFLSEPTFLFWGCHPERSRGTRGKVQALHNNNARTMPAFYPRSLGYARDDKSYCPKMPPPLSFFSF